MKTEIELGKYPYFKSYVESYKNGECANLCITQLAYFFKRMCLDNNLDEQELFNWDNDVAEDFYSWGSNSRWANTFEWWLSENLDTAVKIGLELCAEYGDRDIYAEEN